MHTRTPSLGLRRWTLGSWVLIVLDALMYTRSVIFLCLCCPDHVDVCYGLASHRNVCLTNKFYTLEWGP